MENPNDVESQPLSKAKAACVSDHCPNCGKREFVNVERLLVGGMSITRCHCRACEYSWELQGDPS